MVRHFLPSSFRSQKIRAAIIVSIAIVALPVIPLTAAPAPDGVSLHVEKGPGEGIITLDWIGGEPIFTIYRAPHAMGVLAPEYLVSSTSDRTFVTDVGPETIAFFSVKPPCVADPPERCDGSDNDCNGVIDDPGAESSCSIANASATCVFGTCTIGSCDGGYSDLNTNTADGCEFACQGSDVPDDEYLDANCDGIDGDIGAAVFVSPLGNDADPGTMELPVQSILQALRKASGSGKTQVYLDLGSYVEIVQLVSGISIYGGFSLDSGWARSLDCVPAILGNTVAGGPEAGVLGFGITLPTTLDRVWVQTLDAGPGQNNYAFHCVNCPAITIKNSKLQAGHGGDGANGVPGVPGAAGTNGQQGGSGTGSTGGTGGVRGNSSCARLGGMGGSGGIPFSANGQPGGTGVVATPGGLGGGNGTFTTHPTVIYPGQPGQSGMYGSPGVPGANGAGAVGGIGAGVVGGHWVGYGGSSGIAGAAGNGGGGGGGGGAIDCMLICGAFGGYGGSGGGGGGCPGTPGEGGLAGGGSFGAFFVESDGFVIVNTTISSGDGGQGGAGGTGGIGGAGGIGGPVTGTGGSYVGTGGPGGNGGNGGRGGYGGGGAGGASFALYQSASPGTITGCTLISGVGGAGGTSLGNAGGAGASGTTYP